MRQYLRCRGDDGIWALGRMAGPSYNHTTSADDQCLLLQQAVVYQDCEAFSIGCRSACATLRCIHQSRHAAMTLQGVCPKMQKRSEYMPFSKHCSQRLGSYSIDYRHTFPQSAVRHTNLTAWAHAAGNMAPPTIKRDTTAKRNHGEITAPIGGLTTRIPELMIAAMCSAQQTTTAKHAAKTQPGCARCHT